MSGFVVWFTGLSGSGKSTLATMLAARLAERGVHAEILDGDEIRRNLSKGLGFSKEDRCENLRRLGFVAGVVARTGACAIAAAISPYREVRDQLRGENPRFCEVYCECPISVLTERDPKGLYQKALRGEIKNFTGVTDPYEEPLSPEVRVHTDRETPLQSSDRIMARLEELGYLAALRGATSAPRIVNQIVPASAARAIEAEAASLPSLRLTNEQAELVDGLALGLLSPLGGFMSAREQHCVGGEGRLEGGQPFPEVVALRAPAAAVEALAGAKRVSLLRADGKPFALLDVDEVWAAPAGGEKLLAGAVRSFAPTRRLSGAQAFRAELERRGARRVVGIARNDLAESSLVSALRSALAFHDVALLVGQSDVRPDLPAELVARTLVVATPPGLSPRLLPIVARNVGATHWLQRRAVTGRALAELELTPL